MKCSRQRRAVGVRGKKSSEERVLDEFREADGRTSGDEI